MKTRISLVLIAVVIGVLSLFAEGAAKDSLPSRADQWVKAKPASARWIGLSEIERAAGRRQLAQQALLRADDHPEAVCWQLLPVAQAQVGEFRRQVEKMKGRAGQGEWLPVYELYLAFLEQNRAAMIACADRGPTAPKKFPLAAIETHHLELHKELGHSRLQAGVEVLSHRSFDSLHALRNLDRGLTREAAFLRTTGRDADARKLEAMRDGLRQAYLAASRHLVERLFALNLLGRIKDRDALLAEAQKLPYLGDRKLLAKLFEQVEEQQALALFIDPLLASELELLKAPPDLAKLKRIVVAELQVKARSKTSQGKTILYEDTVQVQLGHLQLTCDRLTVVKDEDSPGVALTGMGSVEVRGLPRLESIRADRFTFSSDTGGFSFGGDVRVKRAEGLVKLRACSVTRTGELRDQRSLFEDLRDAGDIADQLKLLPQISKVYSDDELPAEVRYLLALHLLRPHLTWHAAYAPPREKDVLDQLKEEVDRKWDEADPWREALDGEPWMLKDVPSEVRDALQKARHAVEKELQRFRFKEEKPEATFFWRIKDPAHTDLTRILQLLDGVPDGELRSKARRWAADIRRNNTVLTFDVTGGYGPGINAPLVMDVRNADQVSFKLYRVHKPEEVLWVAHRIGDDFMYRDYGLQQGALRERWGEEKIRAKLDRVRSKSSTGPQPRKPDFRPDNLVQQWTARPAELKMAPFWRHREWYDDDDEDADSHYFNDDCDHFRDRIEKRYRPKQYQLSSWQCDRIVEVPGKALREAGAYVLVAEANGQTAYVPLLVDPLSLTLRRCRDGVFTMVADREGIKPIAGASVHGVGMLGRAVTDAEGVAFARLFAAGDRPILVHKDGRFAIGGFGALFEGIYVSPWDPKHYQSHRLREAMKEAKEQLAQVYADRHVIAAYTDRPTYRPGQEVQFKLILRRLVQEKPEKGVESRAFRAEDFDVPSRMELLPVGTSIRYAVVDSRGREVASDSLTLNDHSTAAGKISLNAETATGTYSLRVHVGGMDRLVPEVFAVQFYRRPSFELQVAGVPEKLKKAQDLKLDLVGKYYFGKPVAGGQVEVRLVRDDHWKSLASAEGKLDEGGKARIELAMPDQLASGRYHIVATLTDDSGRAVSKSLPLEMEGTIPPQGKNGLANLPRFVPVNQLISVSTDAREVTAEQACVDIVAFKQVNGKAVVKLPRTGWYTLKAGTEEVEIFAYGGSTNPFASARRKPNDDEPEEAGWVNLTDYAGQEYDHPARHDRREHQLLALFDRQHVQVGDKLRVLVFAPYKRARILFTLEGRTVMDYFVTWTSGDGSYYHVVEIPIKQRYVPNFYLQGRILAGEQLDAKALLFDLEERLAKARDLEDEGHDPRWCRIDVLDLKLKPGEEKLKVELRTDRQEYRPDDRVDVQMKVTDLEGKSRVAEVSLSAVDESVYTFGEDALHNLAQIFGHPVVSQRFAPKAWRSSLGNRWDIEKHQARLQDQAMQQLRKMQEAKQAAIDQMAKESLANLTSPREERPRLSLAALGGELPASSIPLARLRSDFRETAVWLPQLRTGADGVVQTTFQLPDSLTRYRLTAVALTRETEIGTGRARIQASMPLAVQVILPRFAIEKDHLQALGLIHNNTKKDRVCQVSWEIEGATLEGPPLAIQDWQTENLSGKTVGRGKVKVAAGETVRVGVWLTLERAGTAKVTFRSGDGQDADAETRSLPIHPLGRPREITLNETLPPEKPREGDRFTQEKRITLPAGFIAQDLRLSLSCVDAAQAMEGLGYLVEYPYGCVEQTMSRFLPAVMVKRASQQAPVTLPPDVVAKLPDVLARGLTRLYNHQQPDGSWGWFGKDAANVPMTTYVVYGLARCQATGTTVDPQVLQRGCAYLRGELQKGRLDPESAARAWLAVALAGQADFIELQMFARRMLEARATPETAGNLALACRWVGMNEEGERLFAIVRAWEATTTEKVALKLNCQVAFGASFDDCRQSTRQLLALRTGDRWAHTRDTSWAIEALAGTLAYLPERTPIKRVLVTINGKNALAIADPVELKKPVYRVHWTGEQLPAQEALEVVVSAESEEPIHLSFRATGTQRLDKLEPVGDRVKLYRELETLDGKPIRGPLAVGQVIAVRLTVDLEHGESYLLLEDRRPAGFEYADERITGKAAKSAAHVEFRDDRVCVFHTSLPTGRHEIVYYLRAETPGICHMLPGFCYPMYSEKFRGETGSEKLEIKAP